MNKEDVTYTQKSKLRVLHKYTAIVIILFSLSLFFSNYLGRITTYVNSVVAKCNNKLSDILVNWGLSINTISLQGNHFVSKEEVLEFIDKSKPILFISLLKIKRNIELSNRWIKNVDVQRILPNTIAISIEEYKPFAIWHHGNQFSVIDSTGYVIINDYYVDGLVLIFGNNALSGLDFVKAVVNSNTELSQQISSFNYMRDWNIIFNNGLEVRLSQDNPNDAWNCLNKLHGGLNIMKNNWKAIDLRTQNKIFIKKQKTYHQLQSINCDFPK
ncbi:cell division protein FtsQ/DivIB [Candidatus Mesenet endosymbiont of Agriotes lineatus]|uniref:cell division protein FtsQ/DivIB n=1 Tax=Candidatus Mesenet endosymbiont of Agriotes lineatus TaxID=3077948 RepID=UPI0030CF85AC